MDYQRETWKPFRWHCPNCGKQVIGYKDKSGKIKVSCDSCKTVMIRIIKGRRLMIPLNCMHLRIKSVLNNIGGFD